MAGASSGRSGPAPSPTTTSSVNWAPWGWSWVGSSIPNFSEVRDREGFQTGLYDELTNKAEQLKGKAKERIGKATGDRKLQVEGIVDQATADMKQTGEKVAVTDNNDPAREPACQLPELSLPETLLN